MTLSRTILLMFLLLTPIAADAASLYIENATRNEQQLVRVLVDAEHTVLNVVEGTLTLAPGSSVARIETGGGIIPLWITEPQVEDGRIVFAGMIPGGFQGSVTPSQGLEGSGLLFSIVGDAEIVSAEVNAYVHDGTGTRIPVPLVSLGSARIEERSDTEPPESVRVEIIPASADTPALLVAVGTDAQTGVERYEVSTGGGWSEFVPPLAMPEYSIDMPITVRIFDHAGNFREIIVQDGVSAITWAYLPVFIIVLAAALLLVALRFRNRKRNV